MKKYYFSNNEIDSYKKNGYLVCKNIFDSKEISDLIKWCKEVENFEETTDKWMLYFDPSTKESKK